MKHMPKKTKRVHWTQTAAGKRKLKAIVQQRKERVTETGRQALPEPQGSTRLEQIKRALSSIPFSFTIFFSDESGKSIKYYCGAIVQEEASREG